MSPAWFALLAADPDAEAGGADVVLQQVVRGTPDGEVRYQVSVRDDQATIHQGSPAEADMTFSSDYQTAVAIAAGRLSTEAALSRGLIRISGNLTRVEGQVTGLAGVEALGERRALTSFDTDGEEGGDDA